MYVLAIDPGVTTGWVIADKARALRASGIEHTLRAVALVVAQSVQFLDIVVVVEEFRLFPAAMPFLTWSNVLTAQIVGAIKAAAALRDLSVIEQRPSDAKAHYPDSKLKGYDLPTRHQRDAMRHALYYLDRKEAKDAARPRQARSVSSAIVRPGNP